MLYLNPSWVGENVSSSIGRPDQNYMIFSLDVT